MKKISPGLALSCIREPGSEYIITNCGVQSTCFDIIGMPLAQRTSYSHFGWLSCAKRVRDVSETCVCRGHSDGHKTPHQVHDSVCYYECIRLRESSSTESATTNMMSTIQSRFARCMRMLQKVGRVHGSIRLLAVSYPGYVANAYMHHNVHGFHVYTKVSTQV